MRESACVYLHIFFECTHKEAFNWSVHCARCVCVSFVFTSHRITSHSSEHRLSWCGTTRVLYTAYHMLHYCRVIYSIVQRAAADISRALRLALAICDVTNYIIIYTWAKSTAHRTTYTTQVFEHICGGVALYIHMSNSSSERSHCSL